MLDLAPLSKIAPLFALALIVPGPDFMLISTLALSRGRLAGILGAAGIVVGTSIYIILCMLGIAVVLAKLQWLAAIIRICGGLYLVYLGLQLWKASLKSVPKESSNSSVMRKDRNPFVVGFVTNMTNPKAMAFFTSIFALTLSPDTNLSTQICMTAVMLCMSFGWFGLVALGLSTPAIRKVYMRWSRWIDRVSGTLLALFGLRLMLTGNK